MEKFTKHQKCIFTPNNNIKTEVIQSHDTYLLSAEVKRDAGAGPRHLSSASKRVVCYRLCFDSGTDQTWQKINKVLNEERVGYSNTFIHVVLFNSRI
jgi:spore coat protein U-like protein